MENKTPEITPEKRAARVSKPIAISVFLGVLALIAWLSVQIVSLVPNAFSSLASLAEGISQYRTSLSANNDGAIAITSDGKLADSGKSVTLTWEKDSREGAYAFSYKCIDGVSIDIVDTEGLRNISCDTRYSLGATDTVSIIVNSEKDRHVDVPYTISFMRANDTGPIRTGENTITITNPAISEQIAAEDAEPGAVLGEADTKTEPATPATPPKKPVVVEPTPEYTYEIPVSNPNGFTDLATRFLASGDITNNKFVGGVIQKNDTGAIQFEVKNTGTKTSEKWIYTITLPDGDTYTSPLQTPLKPNERAVIAIGFDTPDDSSHTFKVSVGLQNDKTNTNNSFKKTVSFVK